MSHSHETIDPVKRAPARGPRKTQETLASREMLHTRMWRHWGIHAREWKGKQPGDYRLGQVKERHNESEKKQDFSNRVTPPPSHNTQCLAKENKRSKEIMIIQQKRVRAKMEIKIIKIMVKGTSKLHLPKFSAQHLIVFAPPNTQLSKIEFDRAKQGVNSTRTVIMLNTHAVAPLPPLFDKL